MKSTTGGLEKVIRQFLKLTFFLCVTCGFAQLGGTPVVVKSHNKDSQNLVGIALLQLQSESKLHIISEVKNDDTQLFLVDASDGYLPFLKDALSAAEAALSIEDIKDILQNADKRVVAPNSEAALLNFIDTLKGLPIGQSLARISALERLSNKKDFIESLSEETQNKIANAIYDLILNNLLSINKLLTPSAGEERAQIFSDLRSAAGAAISSALVSLRSIKTARADSLILNLVEKSQEHPVLINILRPFSEELFRRFARQLRLSYSEAFKYLFVQPSARAEQSSDWQQLRETHSLKNFSPKVDSIWVLSKASAEDSVFSINPLYKPHVLFHLLGDNRCPDRAKLSLLLQEALEDAANRNILIRNLDEDALAIETLHKLHGNDVSIKIKIDFFRKFSANPHDFVPEYIPVNMHKLFISAFEELLANDFAGDKTNYNRVLFLNTAFRVSKAVLNHANRDLPTQLVISDLLVEAWRRHLSDNDDHTMNAISHHAAIQALVTNFFYTHQSSDTHSFLGDELIAALAAPALAQSFGSHDDRSEWAEFLIRELNHRSSYAHLIPISEKSLQFKGKLSEAFPEAAAKAAVKYSCEDSLVD